MTSITSLDQKFAQRNILLKTQLSKLWSFRIWKFTNSPQINKKTVTSDELRGYLVTVSGNLISWVAKALFGHCWFFQNCQKEHISHNLHFVIYLKKTTWFLNQACSENSNPEWSDSMSIITELRHRKQLNGLHFTQSSSQFVIASLVWCLWLS